MKHYRLLNISLGWLSFGIAAFVYLITIEPTVSLWDCGEFIASAYKLEVGHPPGAPFFMILARFFSLFAPGKEQVAMFVNAMSGLASAFTIMFLFWTITHIARKIILKNKEELSAGNMIAIFGSGFVGAMAYTFSDTFWFSAVEGEVYATSSLFTAVVFWAILKWENVANQKHANRWLILIAYLMGLSIGVHLLNLLAIPAIVFVYYFKKFKISKKGVIASAAISVLLLAAIMYGIIPGLITMATKFELLFVNRIGMGFNTGALIFAVLLIISLVASIYYTQKQNSNPATTAIFVTFSLFLSGVTFVANGLVLSIILGIGLFILILYFLTKQKVVLNTIILAVTVIIIGYSSFAMIVIRSLADPPMDENNPDNVFALLSYLNREQYGDRPLMYGAYFNMPPLDIKENKNKPVYTKNEKKGKYVIIDYKKEYVYGEGAKTIFPRMYSAQDHHKKVYNNYYKGKRFKVKGVDGNVIQRNDGSPIVVNKPTLFENIGFFLRYQIGHMYMRYFMWNFSGRQNDIQGHGSPLEGNWISGIKFLDAARLGPQTDLPDSLANSKARNKYYMLPFILGLLGFFFHLSRHPKDFSIVTMLFFFTGIAIVIYLNQHPLQPRERDYAYAGSFYAYAIWIGLGVLALFRFFQKYMASPVAASGVTLLCLLGVPTIMAIENLDDHDRSGRYTARDIAKNYLKTCEKNAVLFTNGDNDTFPLWYTQEVEEYRTDVRVCNLMLFNTDWYIEQMSRKAYESDALPITIPEEKYRQGSLDYIRIENWFNKPITVSNAVKYIADENYRNKLFNNQKLKNAYLTHLKNRYGNYYLEQETLDHLPTKKMVLPVDTVKVIENGTVQIQDTAKVLDNIHFTIPKGSLMKSEIMTIDMLANFAWERPVYWVNIGDGLLGLDNNIQHEGLAYRLIPVKTPGMSNGGYGRLHAEKLYDNLMNNYEWGNLNDPDVYIDEFNRHTLRVIRLRHNYTRLANHFSARGQNDTAIQVLDRCVELLPHKKLPYDAHSIYLAEAYYKAQAMEKGDSMVIDFKNVCEEELAYLNRFSRKQKKNIQRNINENLGNLQRMQAMTQRYNPELSAQIGKTLNIYAPPEENPGQNNTIPLQ